jgi:hypothetical protein
VFPVKCNIAHVHTSTLTSTQAHKERTNCPKRFHRVSVSVIDVFHIICIGVCVAGRRKSLSLIIAAVPVVRHVVVCQVAVAIGRQTYMINIVYVVSNLSRVCSCRLYVTNHRYRHALEHWWLCSNLIYIPINFFLGSLAKNAFKRIYKEELSCIFVAWHFRHYECGWQEPVGRDCRLWVGTWAQKISRHRRWPAD